MSTNGTTPRRYEVVVRGGLSPDYAAALEALAVERRPGATVLTCELVDQAALHGLLDRIRDLGIELVSVNEAG